MLHDIDLRYHTDINRDNMATCQEDLLYECMPDYDIPMRMDYNSMARQAQKET